MRVRGCPNCGNVVAEDDLALARVAGSRGEMQVRGHVVCGCGYEPGSFGSVEEFEAWRVAVGQSGDASVGSA